MGDRREPTGKVRGGQFIAPVEDATTPPDGTPQMQAGPVTKVYVEAARATANIGDEVGTARDVTLPPREQHHPMKWLLGIGGTLGGAGLLIFATVQAAHGPAQAMMAPEVAVTQKDIDTERQARERLEQRIGDDEKQYRQEHDERVQLTADVQVLRGIVDDLKALANRERRR
jgi:hypothetical protein